MESLYRKYRPLTFESVVGQQHIVSTLEHAVAEGRLSHAYLFCGPRGTGKTTMARILAKALLCEKSDAARAQGASGCMPDGTCPECEAIAAGTHPDVYELDAASRTGVDNVREEIINSVSFAPVRGAYKVYIIDEVHMLTTAAFNALLKTLEEPPSHVIFVLCTTDPQKILETILSRCQRFDFHRISNEDIVGRLRYICEREGFVFDDEALDIVAKHARGGMRDALSTLEQLSVFGDGSVRADDARALLGEVASTVLAEFACKMAVRDTVGLFGLVRVQVDEGNDLLELTRDLVAHMRDVYTAAIAGPKTELFDGTPEEVAALVEEARLFGSADRLARALTVLDDAALEMRSASDPRLVLEIALTRLARPESDLTLEALAERIARLEAQIAAGVPSTPMGAGQLASMTGTRPAAQAAPAKGGVAPTRGAMPAAAMGRGQRTGAQAAASGPAPDPVTASAAAPAATPVPPAAAVPAANPEPAVAASPTANSASAQVRPTAVETSCSPAPAYSTNPEPGATACSVSGRTAPVATQVPGASMSSSEASATGAPSAKATVSAESQLHMASCAVTPPAADAGELQRRWADAVKRVTAEQPSRGGLLQSSRAVSDDGETLTIEFPKGSTFALKMITRPDSAQLVMPIICQVFGKRSVTYVMEGGPGDAPAPKAASAPAATQGTATVQAAPAQAPAPAAPSAPAAESASTAPARQTAPAQQVAPVVAAPRAVSAAQPASAPVQGRTDVSAQPASAQSAQTVDQVSGPTVLPERDIEADRRAWEDEQVPYDDATIASYADEDELPPFDVPAQPAAPAQPTAPAQPAASATSGRPAAARTPAATAPAAGDAASAPAADAVDAKEVLQNIWGNVVFK
ncbi:DNA polymerase III subunit gamma/tau [Collinsella sp. AF08-23]|uniref:DNA polymerase III subunit gamma/tau n=1 Tax=Collinsella sp. AF08-23 TaxID=2292211 RepID=UPI0018F71252|nr:DNA polymerase III subunit gamma/tau [Collinsella sp. AF08-23]